MESCINLHNAMQASHSCGQTIDSRTLARQQNMPAFPNCIDTTSKDDSD